jgi:flagellin
MTINTNVASMQSRLALQQAQSRSATSIQRLSTGLRINSAKDDPSGLIAATELSSNISQLAAQQTGDDRLYLKAGFADGVLGVVSGVLLEAKSITLQNANGSAVTQKQVDANQRVLDAIVDGISRVGTGTTFIGQRLFGPNVVLASDASGASTGTSDLDPTKVGQIVDQNTGQEYSLADLRTGGALADNADPELAAKVVEAAIKQIAGQRASLGNFQNTLKAMGNVRDITRTNLADALSQIQDTDFAAETTSLVRNQMLAQTSIAATAIANSQPRAVLSLLGN